MHHDAHEHRDDVRDDAETVAIEAVPAGAPVDPPDRPVTWADIVSRDTQRRPIIPAVLRSADQRGALIRHTVAMVAYRVGYHATRTPKYTVKVAVWAPVGAGRLVYRSWRWAYDMEQWHERQHAARRNDVDAYLALMRQADRHRRTRVPIWFTALAAVVAGVALLVTVAPWWIQTACLTAGLVTLAWAGRPADRPILDRVETGPRFVKLTAEQVRTAVVALGIGVKEPGQIRFPVPIHADGPGWLARFDLPGAIIAAKVLDKRENLAAALRLPTDQVWPEVGPEHAGQVDLWVGYQPASKMGQPKWDLASPSARTSVFEPAPFGTDARQRPITATLFETNYLLGGQPGSGKSYAARALGTIALLDPTCELKIAEFKGTGDFLDIEPLCSTYIVGVDDDALDQGRALVAWLLAECERRGKRILEAKKRGEAPRGKVTPELAARRGSGLHPVVVIIDEVHELFIARPETADMMQRAIRRGRALGIIIILATQVPDSTSVPPNITRCVTVRWCLSVGGQVENDMILGTGAYKRGLTGTVYRPGVDAGWGVVVGLDKPGAVRSYFPDPKTTAAIVARAAELRGAVVGGQETVKAEARDLLADVRSVIRPDEAGMPWQVVADRLRELAPEFYVGYTGDMIREALTRYDIRSQDVKTGGKNIKGVRRTALDAAADRLELDAG